MHKQVCHISYNHDAFDDRIYWKELVALKEAGYECTHICVGEEDKEFISAEGIQIIQVKRENNQSNIWLRRLKYLLSQKSPMLNLILAKAIAIKASVYHYHDLQLNALVKPLKKQSWKPVIIYDSHEAYHLLLLEGKKPNILKTLLVKIIALWEIKNAKNCNYIITTDDYTLQYFKRKAPNVPSAIIHNYSYFEIDETKPKSYKYDFIYTGLLNKERGLYEMGELIASLKKDRPAISLLLIGSFEDERIESSFKKFVEKNNLQENLFIHHHVEFSLISKYYTESKIGLGLFHPTPKYITFLPIKLFEYMAFGLPMIFSNQGQAAQIIKDEKSGVLVDVSNSHSILEAAKKLLDDKKLYQEMSVNGKTAVSSRYSWQKEKIKLIKIYESIDQ